MSEAVIEFSNVSKSYGAGNVLEQFNLSIPAGKIVTLIGPSGCGKTTLLKMINRLVEVDSGSVYVEGQDISTLDPVKLRRDIGYVIQQIGLFPHMTIEENITIVPRLKNGRKQEQKKRSDELLRMVGLEPDQFRRRYPHELSGGQQQRIGVARALAADPSIILMDEPFSALDPISRVQLQNELIHLNKKVKKTIVFVTHDIDEALKIADEIVLLKEGKVVQASTPEELLNRPANDYVKEFVGSERYHKLSYPSTIGLHKRRTIAADWISQPVYLAESSSIAEAVGLLEEYGAHGVVVERVQGEYSGVLSVEEVRAAASRTGSSPLACLLPNDVPKVQAHTSTGELLRALKHHQVVPVFDSHSKLLGIVSRVSIIELAAVQFGLEEVVV